MNPPPTAEGERGKLSGQAHRVLRRGGAAGGVPVAMGDAVILAEADGNGSKITV
jgi:hypothetical protein